MKLCVLCDPPLLPPNQVNWIGNVCMINTRMLVHTVSNRLFSKL